GKWRRGERIVVTDAPGRSLRPLAGDLLRDVEDDAVRLAVRDAVAEQSDLARERREPAQILRTAQPVQRATDRHEVEGAPALVDVVTARLDGSHVARRCDPQH